jgi:hypothetical protein
VMGHKQGGRARIVIPMIVIAINSDAPQGHSAKARRAL